MNIVQKKYIYSLLKDLLLGIIAFLIICLLINFNKWYYSLIIGSIIFIVIFINGEHRKYFKTIKPFLRDKEMLNLIKLDQFHSIEIETDKHKLCDLLFSNKYIFVNKIVIPIKLLDGYWINNNRFYLTLKNGKDCYIGKVNESLLVNQFNKFILNNYNIKLKKYNNWKEEIRNKTNSFYDEYNDKDKIKKFINS